MAISYDYDDEIAANVRKLVTRRPKEQDFIGSQTLTMMRRKGVSVSGHFIEADVQFVGDVVGDAAYTENQQLPTHHIPSLTRAQYQPAFYAKQARMSKQKRDLVKGPGQLFDEWARRASVARMRLDEEMATDLFATTLVTPKMTGIPLAIPATATTGTYGLDRSVYSFWQNYTQTSVGAFAINGSDAMDNLSLNIQLSHGRKPDWYVTTKALFQKMKKTARSGTTNFDPTYSGPYRERLNDTGIESISFEGSPMIWDNYCPTGFIYGIRDDAFYLGELEAVTSTEIYQMGGAGILGQVMYVTWSGNTVCEEQRALGQLSDVT